MSSKTNAQNSVKMKTAYNRDLILLYKEPSQALDAWKDRHPGMDRLFNRIKGRLAYSQCKAKELISSWKHSTPIETIECDWKNIISTAKLQSDMVYAFFNIMDGGYDDADLLIEDLVEGRISPAKYLRQNVVTGEPHKVSAKESFAELMKTYAGKSQEYYDQKNIRDLKAQELKNVEGRRHSVQTNLIEKWTKENPDAEPAYTWMKCIEQDAHARIYNKLSLLPFEAEARDREIEAITRLGIGYQERINSVINTVARYKDAIEAEAAAERKRVEEEEAARKAEEEAARKAEEERRQREADEAVKCWEEENNKEMQQKMQELQAKFNKPQKNKKETVNMVQKIGDNNKTKEQDTKSQQVEIKDIDINLAEFGLDHPSIDTTKAYNIYIDNDTVWLSDALGVKLYERNIFTVCCKENKGSAYLIFGTQFSDALDIDDNQHYFVKSEEIAESIRSIVKCQDKFQTHTYKLGQNNGMIFVMINQ